MSTKALHVGQRHHQPWCRIHHNPAMTAECWCDAQMAATAYKLGVAEGMAMAVLRNQVEVDDEADRYRVVSVPDHALGEGGTGGHGDRG